MKRILFQGDSITDTARNREAKTGFNAYGCGYTNFVAGELCVEAPGAVEFYNRGVSGDRVVDLYARWRRDCIQLKPDVISILIGVNDVWHELGNGNGVPPKRFEKVLRMLIEETREELPGVKFMLMEPFLLHGSATNEHYDAFFPEVRARAEIVERLAKEYDIPFIPLQSVFDEALKVADDNHWAIDGVHPSHAGHALIAKQWIAAYKKYIAE